MKQKYFWLKLVGTALLLHIVLILLSIIEVIIYSYLINPGHDEAFYQAHAMRSAPWISYIFGSLFTFLLVKRFIQRFEQQWLLYAIALPILYSIIDFLLVIGIVNVASALDPVFLVGKAVKILAGLLAYYIYAKKSGNQKSVSGSTA